MTSRGYLVLAVIFLAISGPTVAALQGGAGGAKKTGEPKNEFFKIGWAFNSIGQVGFKVKDKDKWQPITYSFQGTSNVALVRIDGQDTVYGSKEGEMEEYALIAGPKNGPKKVGRTFAWQKGKIAVEQQVQAYQSNDEFYDVCLIRYTFTNRDNVKHEVGLRYLLDTLVVDNDACAFRLPEAKKLIVDKADFPKDEPIPGYLTVQQMPSLTQPGLQAVLTLKIAGKVGGRDLPSPDRVLITHMPPAWNTWDVGVEPIRDDSVVVIYWNPRWLEPSGEFSVAFAYGLNRLKLKN